MKFPYATVLISGASSGVGEAIAYECVRRGAKTLFLGGRNAARLAAVAEKCRELAAHRVSLAGDAESFPLRSSASAPTTGDAESFPLPGTPGCAVHTSIVDVTDESATRDWINRADAIAPLDLVFANAGVATGVETEVNVRTTFATNVGGVLNVSLPAIEIFRRHHSSTSTSHFNSHLVLTASIAGYAPLPTCPSYSATKSCVKTWGLAMRGMLKKEGINVSVLCPGFIRSRMTDVNTCPMPFFMEADKAARIILDRVSRNVGLIAFPWPMRLSVWALSCLPARLTEFIASLLPAKIKRQGVVTDGVN